MKVKLFELRDRATFVPAIAIEVGGESEQENFLLKRAGFDLSTHYVLLASLNGGPLNYDLYSWSNLTFKLAHDYIEKNWNGLKSGQVIDVEFILGEKKRPKVSEKEIQNGQLVRGS